MKKSKKQLAKAVGVYVSAAAVSAALLAGCDFFHPFQQEPEHVYGPPPDPRQQYDPADDLIQGVYGPPIDNSYDPAADEEDWVYGPPEDDDWETPAFEDW